MSKTNRKREEAKVVCWFIRQYAVSKDPRTTKNVVEEIEVRDHAAEMYVRAVFAVHEFRAKYPEFKTTEEIAIYVKSGN